jgi:putative redox protein
MANQIKLTFDDGLEGLLESANFETKVSYTGQGMAPYELLLGGFASCLHATFMGIMRKRKLEYSKVTYDIVANKREEVPTIINKLVANIVIYGSNPDKQKAVLKSMDQAEKYCSISETIKRLDAEMIFNVEFK